MVSDLIERLHAPIFSRFSSGTEVRTPRGYGTIVGFITGEEMLVLVELDGDGIRASFHADQLQVVERVGT